MTLKQRLVSRKLWLAVVAFITFVLNKQYPEAMAVIIGYTTIQGAADIVDRYTGTTAPVVSNVPKGATSNPFLVEDDVDRSKIETGVPLFDETLKED